MASEKVSRWPALPGKIQRALQPVRLHGSAINARMVRRAKLVMAALRIVPFSRSRRPGPAMPTGEHNVDIRPKLGSQNIVYRVFLVVLLVRAASNADDGYVLQTLRGNQSGLISDGGFIDGPYQRAVNVAAAWYDCRSDHE